MSTKKEMFCMGPPLSHACETNVCCVDEAARDPFNLASFLPSSSGGIWGHGVGVWRWRGGWGCGWGCVVWGRGVVGGMGWGGGVGWREGAVGVWGNS